MDMSKVIQHPFFNEVRKTGKTQEINEWCVNNNVKNLAGMVLMPELREDDARATALLDTMYTLLQQGKLTDTTPQALIKGLEVAGDSHSHKAEIESNALSGEDKFDLSEVRDEFTEQSAETLQSLGALQGNVPIEIPKLVPKSDPAEVEDLAKDAMQPHPDSEVEIGGVKPHILTEIREYVQEQVTEAMARAIPTIVTAVLDETDKRYVKGSDYTVTLSINKEDKEDG